MVEYVGLNSHKSIIEEQSYEEYWKSTLALTGFFEEQFIITLKLIIEHIDKYKLDTFSDEELIENMSAKKKQFNQSVSHAKELEQTVFKVFPNVQKDGASTRKQLNTFVKLGFIKPFLRGYVPAAKQFVDSNTSYEERRRLFSDTVYQYASLNSSQTNDDTKNNQIKFLVNTLLNKPDKHLSMEEFIGIMRMDVSKQDYADERTLRYNMNYAQHISFYDRKYNQVNHLKLVLKAMNLFEVYELKKRVGDKKRKEFAICLAEDAKDLIPEKGDTKRDSYRFALMKKAVIAETISIYGKQVSWLSKTESKGMVVSHIYASADALREWDIDAAYDPKNALYLKPGNEDQYFDKYEMTFGENGIPIFADTVSSSFIEEAKVNQYKLDEEILTPERLYYLTNFHQKYFKGKQNL
ncbi:hypothetical protein [Streptococcus suis]|uniref:hypothetical protein n=1 Tax=Streptococcus suis TaxID=1307 RepID=UPI0003F627F6|nr:hypothetical protein [Streptococcus suis]NQH22428.1 hypothetical protein [Streptococcus suis]CYV21583.1 Uncharacterised protein [Streptococcus suis]HEL1601190.1 hypothetical protein [Streptococcus suis]HEL2290629.1 hypothetical protein [Streptococcus suis]HEL2310039.1 hypothetical protein [Streptococcus suis]